MSLREPRIGPLNHAVWAGACAVKAINGKLRVARFVLGFAALYAFCIVPGAAGAGEIEGGLELEKVADLVNVIVAANREAYSQAVVNRLMVQEKVIRADEQYAKKRALLLPAHFFRAVAEIAGRKDSRAVYSLQSFWSIRPQNLPKSEIEKVALAKVLGGTAHFYGTETAGGSTYFIAAYPDVATNEACVTCHNNHPESRRHDFVIGDVMGGVVVRIPMGEDNGGAAADAGANRSTKMSYRDVAGLVRAIVAANREAYSTLIVDRLVSQEHVIATDEHYIDKKCLPLPVQLFNLGALLANAKTRTATYGLRSPWPLNGSNLPASDVERNGLAALAAGEDRFFGIEVSGPAKTLVAVYPDRAVGENCVACHNAHPNSPRKDLKTGDILGGVVVRIPMSD